MKPLTQCILSVSFVATLGSIFLIHYIMGIFHTTIAISFRQVSAADQETRCVLYESLVSKISWLENEIDHRRIASNMTSLRWECHEYRVNQEDKARWANFKTPPLYGWARDVGNGVAWIGDEDKLYKYTEGLRKLERMDDNLIAQCPKIE
jgi:hypothetical protein